MPNKTIQGRRTLAALCVAAILAVMAPRLAGTGMFVDGITYATLARNLALDPSPQLWHLHYTHTLHADFYEHPPGGIWLLAAVFWAVGDVPWAETLYAALLTAAFFASVAALWRAARPDRQVGSWLPGALSLAFPLTSWVFSNGMLEGPMTVACVLAAAASFHGWASLHPRRAWGWGLLAGLATAAGVLIKGPFALFLLVLPALAPWLRPGTAPRQSEWTTAGMVFAMAAVAAAVYLHPEAHAYMARYGSQQLWSSLQGGREIAASRFTALSRLFGELAVAAVLGLGLQAVARRLIRGTLAPPPGIQARAWALLGLSASLPVLLSPKQSGWYIFQSLPCFAMALACWVSPAAMWAQHRAARYAPRLMTLARATAVLALVVAGVRWGHLDKHRAFHETFTQQSLAPMPGARWTVCPPQLLHDWSLHANVARYLEASLTTEPGPWLLIDRQGPDPCAVPPGCTAMHPPAAQRYTLYRCATGEPGQS